MFLPLLLLYWVFLRAAFCNDDAHPSVPLIGLSHSLSADGVQVLDDRTLLVRNLNYDGLSPDARFWAGVGPAPHANGTPIPDEKGGDEKLRSYSGANLTLRVPDHVNAYELDWFGVWCVLDEEDIGHAMLRQPDDLKLYLPKTTPAPPTRPPLRTVGPLSTLDHGVSSGPVAILDAETLLVPNFRYDGEGPDAFFWIGRGPAPSENGVKIAYGTTPGERLGAYHGVDVTLRLPEGLTVDDIDWLSVWCVTYKHDFGHVKFHEEKEEERVPDLASRFGGEDERTLGEFSRLRHGLRSGRIRVINSTSFLIPDLHYDGKGPDAHFWAGNGSEPSESGVKVPYKNYLDTLPAFKGEDVTITLPGGLTVDNIEWLGVWCIEYKQNFGFVRLREAIRKPIKTVAEFSRLAHGLRSGNISILDERTIFIPDLNYDGLGPDAHFWIGNGSELTGNGVPVPYGNYDVTLPAFNGENVTLALPDGYTVDNIDWIGVWCIKYKHNFGFTLLHPKVESLHVRLEPFKQLAHGLRSGPIFIINEMTLFVTNLHYDGKGPDAYFWIGKGSQGPNSEGTRIPDERNSTDVLREYAGEDVYLRLPKGMSVHDIDYVGMWCVKFQHNFGYTEIPKDLGERVLPDLGYYERDADDNYIARIPKCCPAGEMKTPRGCVRKTVEVANINIYEGNMTKFDDEPLQHVSYEPYLYNPNCPFGMYYLDPAMDTYYLLTGGMLLIAGESEVTKDRFCIDIRGNASGWRHVPFLCFPDDAVPQVLNKIYAGCIYVSAIFLMVTSFVFIWFEKARDMRGFNVVGYSVTMAVSFVCLATARLLHVTEAACTSFGYAYQFFLLSSFTWLFCLTYEIHHRIKWYNVDHSKKRFYYYAGAGFGIPIASLALSYSVSDMMPNNLNRSVLLHDACWFTSDKKIIFYYVPIMISILINTVFNIWTSFLIRHNDKQVHDTYWPLQKQDLKNVFRSCYMLLIVMTICWISEILSYFFDDMRNGIWIAIDIIDSLQGLFVFLIFILHNPVNDILRDLWKSRRRQEDTMRYDVETEKLHATPRPPTAHLESLTKIKHADSDENLNS